MNVQQVGRFANARHQIESGEALAFGIETMMELALEANSITLRRWAQVYLKERFNVAVTETSDETTSATGHVSR